MNRFTVGLRRVIAAVPLTLPSLSRWVPPSPTRGEGFLSALGDRDRAKQVRESVVTCRDPLVKQDLEMVATQFEWLAEEVERGIISR